MYVLDVK